MDIKDSHQDEPHVHRKPVPESASRPQRSRYVASDGFNTAAITGIILLFLPLKWIGSGTPLLIASVILGEFNGCRVLPWVPIWTIFATLNLVYVMAATSWLFYWMYTAMCWPAVVLSCLFQFDTAANFGRRFSRKILGDLHFISDTISFFGLPALEIDTEVSGLFVVRGITFCLSTLSVTAHGVEVGIKLADDMELAIQTDKVDVSLLRKIEIGDVYANIKGGEMEMSFGTVPAETTVNAVDKLLVSDTPMLAAAATAASKKRPMSPKRMLSTMTHGKPPMESFNSRDILKPVISISPDEEKARKKYEKIVQDISRTSTVNIAKKTLEKAARENGTEAVLESEGNMRAAICAHIHDQPSIPHPPSKSVRLSTIKQTKYPQFKIFLHRLPLLLRVLLNPLSYFHPVSFKSVTVAGSGKYMVSSMQNHFFKHYSSHDSDIRRLERRISAWLADANFAIGLGKMNCTAQVPINTAFDIECNFKIGDLMAHRTLLDESGSTQVVRLGGADATIALPSYLLPHHEHILPPIPTEFAEMQLEQEVKDADGTPQTVQLIRDLEQLRKDETNMRISAHAHLPAVFDQELLNFIAALIKATKVIELEKDHEEMVMRRSSTIQSEETGSDRESVDLKRPDSIVTDQSSMTTTATDDTDATTPASPKSFNKFIRKMDRGLKDMNTKVNDGWRKAGISTVQAMANDRWIARIVGNVLRKMEKAQGDVGYSGLIPLPLAEYRERAEPESKLLP